MHTDESMCACKHQQHKWILKFKKKKKMINQMEFSSLWFFDMKIYFNHYTYIHTDFIAKQNILSHCIYDRKIRGKI